MALYIIVTSIVNPNASSYNSHYKPLAPVLWNMSIFEPVSIINHYKPQTIHELTIIHNYDFTVINHSLTIH